MCLFCGKHVKLNHKKAAQRRQKQHLQALHICMNGRAYLLCKAECCGPRRAGERACPGSSGRHYPPPSSENGSESTAQLYGKGRRSQTQHFTTHTHTHRPRKRCAFSVVLIIIDDSRNLYKTDLVMIRMQDRKQTPNIFEVKHSSLFSCLKSEMTKKFQQFVLKYNDQI